MLNLSWWLGPGSLNRCPTLNNTLSANCRCLDDLYISRSTHGTSRSRTDIAWSKTKQKEPPSPLYSQSSIPQLISTPHISELPMRLSLPDARFRSNVRQPILVGFQTFCEYKLFTTMWLLHTALCHDASESRSAAEAPYARNGTPGVPFPSS